MHPEIKSGTLSYVRVSSWPCMLCIVELSLGSVLCSCFFLALYVMYRGIKSGTLSYEIKSEPCPMFVLLLGPVWYVSWSSGGLPAIW